jgi:hypothetical protein
MTTKKGPWCRAELDAAGVPRVALLIDETVYVVLSVERARATAIFFATQPDLPWPSAYTAFMIRELRRSADEAERLVFQHPQ